MSIRYIGADVDCKMTELAVLEGGRIVARERVRTDIGSIGRFLRVIPGPKLMVVEEGPMAGWLYRNLRMRVDRLVVCDPRRNRLIACDGDKTDVIDAAKLAALLRGGYLREVYHTQDEGRVALKEAVGLYHDRVREAVRQINKLRGRCRCHGLSVPGRAIRRPSHRAEWLASLKHPALGRQLEILWLGLDAVLQQVGLARREMGRLARGYPIIRLWRQLPGVGLIRAGTLLAYLDTPWRFGSAKKLYRYCGVGLKQFSSGSNEDGSPRPGHLRLFRGVNRRLKDAVMGAALSAICQGNNPFADYYRRVIAHGLMPCNARHSVARKQLRVMWGMWKTNTPYDERLV